MPRKPLDNEGRRARLGSRAGTLPHSGRGDTGASLDARLQRLVVKRIVE